MSTIFFPEVNSLRAGKVILRDGYATIDSRGEMMLYNVHISFYSFATHNPNEPLRVRKLLLHKREIRHLRRAIERKGMTVVPLELYLRGSLIKLKIGIARGKRQYDKRDAMRKRDDERSARRTLKERSY